MSQLPPMSDDEFLARFLDSTIPPAGFNHVGHLRAAWLLLQRLPPDEAVQATCDAIARLAARLNVPGKYHRTVTEALVRLMASRGGADRALSWQDFLNCNTDLVEDGRAVLARHYSDECLFSPLARSQFVWPDRQPLPA